MDGNALGLIELLLVVGVVLGFGIWQLVSVRRELKRDRAAAAKSEPPKSR